MHRARKLGMGECDFPRENQGGDSIFCTKHMSMVLFSRSGMMAVMLLVSCISVMNMKVTRSFSIGTMQELVSVLVPGGVATKIHAFALGWSRGTISTTYTQVCVVFFCTETNASSLAATNF